jgi:hypothetical protein
MEKLAEGFHSQISLDLGRPMPLRRLYLCEADAIEELQTVVKPAAGRFCLFLLMDARSVDASTTRQTAGYLAEQGMVYLCAWGPECSVVEDLFDEGTREFDEALTGDDVIMNTSHPKDSLEQALWFFVHSTFPTAGLSEGCQDWVVACVGNAAWANEIRRISHDVVYSPLKD